MGAPSSTSAPSILLRAVASAAFVVRLGTILLEDVFPAIGELAISMEYGFSSRGLPHGEAYVLSLIAAYLAPKRIFEIGTGHGEGALLMLRQAQGAHVDTLDLGEVDPSLAMDTGDDPIADLGTVGTAYRESPYASQVTQHFGDSASFDYSPFAGSMDLVYVDGAHSYAYAKADSLSAFSLIRPGGTILWDDCHFHHPGVGRALLGLSGENRPIKRLWGTRLAVMRDPRTA